MLKLERNTENAYRVDNKHVTARLPVEGENPYYEVFDNFYSHIFFNKILMSANSHNTETSGSSHNSFLQRVNFKTHFKIRKQ